MSFNIGDRVRAIDSVPGHLEYGDYGTVTQLDDDMVWVRMDGKTDDEGWFDWRFELVASAQPTLVIGDRVRVIDDACGSLEMGAIGTVQNVYGEEDGEYFVDVQIDGRESEDFGWYQWRFEKVTEPEYATFAIGDRVMADGMASQDDGALGTVIGIDDSFWSDGIARIEVQWENGNSGLVHPAWLKHVEVPPTLIVRQIDNLHDLTDEQLDSLINNLAAYRDERNDSWWANRSHTASLEHQNDGFVIMWDNRPYRYDENAGYLQRVS